MNKKTIVKDLTPGKDLMPDGKVLSLIYSLLFLELDEFEDVYMVEVKLDNAEDKLISGDFICHVAPHQLKTVAEHLYDEEWIVLHKRDKIFQQVDKNKVKELLRQLIKSKEEQIENLDNLERDSKDEIG